MPTPIQPIRFSNKDAARAVDECVGPRSDAHRRAWDSSIFSSLNRLGADLTLNTPPRRAWKPEPAGVACRFTLVWDDGRVESFEMGDPGIAARYLASFADGYEAARRHTA